MAKVLPGNESLNGDFVVAVSRLQCRWIQIMFTPVVNTEPLLTSYYGAFVGPMVTLVLG